jgi:hypothetical protein
MSSVWILGVDYVSFIDSLATVSTSQWIVLISQLDLGGATDRADSAAFYFVIVSKFVMHLCLLDRGQLLDCRN